MAAERIVLLGHPVAHSLSPVFQGAALRAAGIAATYELLDVPPEQLGAVVAQLRAERWRGNITLPHKELFAAHCDSVSAVAERVGAVNTYWCDRDGRLHGENTDVDGFDAAARALLGNLPANATSALPPPVGQTVALLGAGGSAAAVCEAVGGWPGATLRIYARRGSRAAGLVSRYASRYASRATLAASVADALQGATLVVNATPIGLADDAVPVPPELLAPATAVMDLVYRPGRTPFVRACRARGLRARDGLGMLVEQGARAFECWFGLVPDREAMWASVVG